ncbi:MAG: exopolyphosphatase, partial [Sphingobacteriaceae bacterium]
MKKRIAALDLGTNTFHLIIADVYGNEIEQIVYHTQKHVKLGEGGITNGIIAEPAYERGLQALSEFKTTILEHKVDSIRAVGTAALRSASNGEAFILQVKEKTGIEIE